MERGAGKFVRGMRGESFDSHLTSVCVRTLLSSPSTDREPFAIAWQITDIATSVTECCVLVRRVTFALTDGLDEDRTSRSNARQDGINPNVGEGGGEGEMK